MKINVFVFISIVNVIFFGYRLLIAHSYSRLEAQDLHEQLSRDPRIYVASFVTLTLLLTPGVTSKFFPKSAEAIVPVSTTREIYYLGEISTGDSEAYYVKMQDGTVSFCYEDGNTFISESVQGDKVRISSGEINDRAFVVIVDTKYEWRDTWLCFWISANKKERTYTIFIPRLNTAN